MLLLGRCLSVVRERVTHVGVCGGWVYVCVVCVYEASIWKRFLLMTSTTLSPKHKVTYAAGAVGWMGVSEIVVCTVLTLVLTALAADVVDENEEYEFDVFFAKPGMKLCFRLKA